jgi:hypothetical protein
MKKKVSTLWGIMILLVIGVGAFVYVNKSVSDLKASSIEVSL